MKKMSKRILSVVIVLCLLMAYAMPIHAVDNSGIHFKQVDNSAVTGKLPHQEAVESETDAPVYEDTDIVRVSIVLEKKSTLEAGYSTQNIANNDAAMRYRSSLETLQTSVANRISKKLGETLDVVWNMTLAANIISANVAYGDIETIKSVTGVADVIIETQYEPAQTVETSAESPNMYFSTGTTGASTAWTAGLTGAGSRIAIIDTGLDVDHQSFDNDAFLYAMKQNAAQKNMTLEEYIASKDLLDVDEISSVLSKLNAAARYEGLTAEDLYQGEKLAYTFNYVDNNLNVTHLYDLQGEHGSHVAGIATANRYLDNGDGTYSNAMEETYVTGNAPDAQILVMKVFGQGGGAFDSDYMVAIEDAILLGCDSVNLSLGSAAAGMTTSAAYQAIMDNLVNSDTVVVISSGNNSYWAENSYFGYNYSDDANFQTDGSPGSFANAFTVGSVDNNGIVTAYLVVGGEYFFTYYEGAYYGNAPMATLAADGDKTLDYVFLDGLGYAEEFQNIDVTGKVVFIKRGEINFAEKANNAAAAGAAAVIVYNHGQSSDGYSQFGMNLSGYNYSVPVVSLDYYTACDIRDYYSTASEDGTYYTGTITVPEEVGAFYLSSGAYSMSSFSSWGVPGDLSMKPEIVAPGGNIYSLYGMNAADTDGDGYADGYLGGHDQYELMSGTSMAAPNIAGLAALMAQYLEEYNVSSDILTDRALIQSLMMSTAKPMTGFDSGSDYAWIYPVMQQGAGIISLVDAMNADSYIIMGEDATASWADGKVKAELGDDPQRTGTYKFSFSVNNLTAETLQYTLSADVFTQDVFSYENWNFMDTWTTALGADVTFTVGGQTVSDTVSVPANGSVTVEVTVQVNGEGFQYLESCFPNGAYVEAYIYAEPVATKEGVVGAVHSIPMLAFYGDWAEPSMYDRITLDSYHYGTYTNIPYLSNGYTNFFSVNYQALGEEIGLIGNPLVDDDVYMPERNAINNQNGDEIGKLYFTLIRNAGDGLFTIRNVQDDTYYMYNEVGGAQAAYFNPSYGAWYNTQYNLNLGWEGTDAEGSPLPENTTVELALTMVPEYFVAEDGTVDWEAVANANNTLSTTVTIDNTAPAIDDIQLDQENNLLTVTATDNQYVAAVALFNANGSVAYSAVGAKQDIGANTAADFELDLTGVSGKKFYLQVYDYAMNTTTYLIETQIGAEQPLPEMMAFALDVGCWISFDQTTSFEEGLPEHSYTNNTYTAATIVDHIVLAATNEGVLYAMPEDDLADEYFVGDLGLGLTDMAYSVADDTVYGVTTDGYDYYLVTIDRYTAETEILGTIPVWGTTLACDEDGTFYTVEEYTSDVYAWTLADLNNAIPAIYDFNGDGVADLEDGQALLDYATGVLEEITNAQNADFNGDGLINSYDSYLYLFLAESGQLTGAELIATVETDEDFIYSEGVQSMEINPNNGMLCWTSFMLEEVETEWGIFPSGVSYYVEIDPATGEYTVYNDLVEELCALIIPEESGEASWGQPTDEVTGIQLSKTSMTMICGSKKQLTATVQPWTVTNRTVTWTTSDASVATVNANGVVTGISEGTAVITATSVLDPSVSASCTVTVDSLDVTIKGMLQDEEGYPKFFDWNLETDTTWNPGADMDLPLNAATYDPLNDVYYVMDSTNFNIHVVNPDGTTAATYTNTDGYPRWDMAYSELYSTEETPMVASVWGWYFFTPDPVDQLTLKLVDMSETLSQVGATYLTSIASMGVENYMTQYGMEMPAEHFVLLDDAGNVWHLWLYGAYGYWDVEGAGYVSDLDFEFTLYDDAYMFSSLVAGDDGALYLSGFNGDTNEFYRMTYDPATGTYLADYVGDVGQDVWPAIITGAESNGDETASVPGSSTGVPLKAELVTLSRQDLKLEESTVKIKSLWSDSKLAVSKGTFNPIDVARPMSDSYVEEGEEMVYVTLTAKDAAGEDTYSTNGVFTVTYDPEALELIDYDVEGFYTSVNEEEGTVTIGYVDRYYFNPGDPIAELVFLVLSTDSESVTVTHQELNNQQPGYNETVAIEYEHANTKLVDAKDATCTEDGYTGDLVCSDCGKVLEEGQVIPATGHSHEASVTAPTCTEQGYTTYTCSKCGDTYVADYTDPTGHTFGEWTETKAPTCTEKGEKSRTCETCGHVETEQIPALGHSYQDTVVEPTPESDGYTEHTCEHCGASYKDNYTEYEDPSNSDTGDAFAAMLWICLLTVSAAAAAMLLVKRKKWF